MRFVVAIVSLIIYSQGFAEGTYTQGTSPSATPVASCEDYADAKLKDGLVRYIAFETKARDQARRKGRTQKVAVGDPSPWSDCAVKCILAGGTSKAVNDCLAGCIGLSNIPKPTGI